MALSMQGEILTQDNYNNLHLLTTVAIAWVIKKFDELCRKATADLELEAYEILASRKSATYTVPTLAEAGVRRTTT